MGIADMAICAVSGCEERKMIHPSRYRLSTRTVVLLGLVSLSTLLNSMLSFQRDQYGWLCVDVLLFLGNFWYFVLGVKERIE